MSAEEEVRVQKNLMSLLKINDDVDDMYLGAIQRPPSPEPSAVKQDETPQGPASNPEIQSPHKKVSTHTIWRTFISSISLHCNVEQISGGLQAAPSAVPVNKAVLDIQSPLELSGQLDHCQL